MKWVIINSFLGQKTTNGNSFRMDRPVGEDVNETTIFNLVRPPPFVLEKWPLLDPYVSNAPGKIEIGKNGELLLKYLTFRGVVADQIANYDKFVLEQIPLILDSKILKISDTRWIKFINPQIILPRESSLVDNPPIILPRMARERRKTYAFTLLADVIEINPKTQMITNQKKMVELGNIPAMLGSVADHLRARKMTKNSLLQAGECIQDPFGYFIIEGKEKIILIQEKLRGNRVLIFNDREGDPNCQLTSISTRGSTVVNMYQDKDGSIKLFYSLLAIKSSGVNDGKERGKTKNKGVKTVNILSVLRLLGKEYDRRSSPEESLGLDNLEIIVNSILAYVRDDWKKKVLLILQSSFIRAAEIGDDYRDIYSNSVMKARWDRAKKKSSSETWNPENPKMWENTKAQLLKGTLDRLFSHIGYDDSIDIIKIQDPKLSGDIRGPIQQKIILLSIMIAKFAEHLAGLRKIDDRDDWANKRLETGGAMMNQLFRQLWYNVMDEIENKINRSRRKITVESIARSIIQFDISSGLENAFKPNKWGAPKTKTKFRKLQQNITDTLDRGQSIIAALTHLTRIRTPTNSKDKNPNVRAVQLSQTGYIDLVDTPSGGAVGLVKYKALTCWISVVRSVNPFWDNLSNKVSPNYTDERHNILIVNGIPSGWCNAISLRKETVALRRSLRLGFDVTIVIDEDILYIYTGGSRPTRPLLIIDEDGIPLIEKKKMWNKDFKTILAAGVVEYVGPWENQKHNVICPSLQTLNQNREDLIRNKHLLTEYESQLPTLKRQLVIHSKPENVSQEEIQTKINSLNERVEPRSRQFGPADPLEAWLIASGNLTRVENQIGRVKLNIKRLERKKYTHLEMDPTAILGIAASAIPFIGSNPGPRNNFQCSMFRQAIGINTSNPAGSYSTTDKFMSYPTRPLAGTLMQKLLGLDDLPSGANIILAIATTSTNEEDAITIKKEALERGLFTYTVLHSYNITLGSSPRTVDRKTGDVTSRMDFLVKPAKPFPGHTSSNYENLNHQGLPIVDTLVSPGDALIGATRVVMVESGGKAQMSYQDITVYLHPHERGVIDSVLVAKTPTGKLSVTVRIRSVGKPIIGDKVALRSAQKSVIGGVVEERFMPVTEKGLTPDIIINPHAIPKRMTISTLIEIVTSKYAASAGERINATAFRTFELDSFTEILTKVYGYRRSGGEILRNPISGELIPSEIMIGPSYYQLLKHQVLDKVQVRGTGPTSFITGQAVKGRKHGGGIRFGEMEKDATIAHGAARFLQERLFTEADPFSTAFCANCKMMSIGDLMGRTTACTNCDSRELLGCTIPRSFKALMNYASALGIQISPQLEEKVRQLDPDEIIEIKEDIGSDENDESLELYQDLFDNI